jgi:electron transport complex protein RnfB
MENDVYKLLAERLDSLPNGFPSTQEGAELRLLAKLFSPEEAALASCLSPHLETAEEIASRTGYDAGVLRKQLKGMVRRGLIATGRTESGLGYGLMPFVVGIYEMQVNSLDVELAHLFEDYFQLAFGEVLKVKPQLHRVIPVNESVKNNTEIHPFESAAGLVNAAQSWGVLDCICRKQKALIGQACKHPVDVCMVLEQRPGAFDGSSTVRALSQKEALATLQRAAEAGLVHSVSNNQAGIQYICNCCTCSCGILQGMAKLGIANVVASSAFVNQVDEILCSACDLCIEYCQFDALTMDGTAQVNGTRCVGCGVCVMVCATDAMGLVRRPAEEVMATPETLSDWGKQRAMSRGLEA